MRIDVENLGPDNRIELYVKPGCPYCADAEAFYRRKGLTYQTYNAQDDTATKRRMLELSSGNPTTPAIVVDARLRAIGVGEASQGLNGPLTRRSAHRSDLLDVGENKTLAFDDLSDANRDRRLEHRSLRDHGMELAVFAARIDAVG